MASYDFIEIDDNNPVFDDSKPASFAGEFILKDKPFMLTPYKYDEYFADVKSGLIFDADMTYVNPKKPAQIKSGPFRMVIFEDCLFHLYRLDDYGKQISFGSNPYHFSKINGTKIIADTGADTITISFPTDAKEKSNGKYKKVYKHTVLDVDHDFAMFLELLLDDIWPAMPYDDHHNICEKIVFYKSNMNVDEMDIGEEDKENILHCKIESKHEYGMLTITNKNGLLSGHVITDSGYGSIYSC